ncbi:Hypothetical predicted protein [Cloeon dipterum]|nr:Hypothetical predicted protein [Cloeon dipterum]
MLHIKTTFPVSEFIVVFGFLFVVVLEQIVLDCQQSDQPIAHEVPRGDLEQSTEVLEDEERSIGSDIQDPTEHVHPSLRSVLLVAALSLHSVLEGVAIGLQPSVDSVVQISAAVMLHKAVIAFSLGLNLVQSALGLTAILQSCLVFCSTSPIGIGLGMLADDMGHTPQGFPKCWPSSLASLWFAECYFWILANEREVLIVLMMQLYGQLSDL